jgi:hypothetical protein
VNVHVRHRNHPVGIGFGMPWIEHETSRSIVLVDPGYFDFLRTAARSIVCTLRIAERLLKNHHLPLVRLPIETARRIGVGDILRDHFHPHAFGREGRGGAIDAG